MKMLNSKRLPIAMLLFVCMMSLSSHLLSDENDSEISLAPQAGTLFIVHFSLGPNWNAEKQAHEQKFFKEHSENLRKMRTDKKLLIGARYADKGMIIIKAADEAEAKTMIERDPMVANNIFQAEMHSFQPFYDGCIDSKSR